MNNYNARMGAYKILYKIEKEKAFSNIALKEGLRGSMSAQDKRLITSVVYGCVKYKRFLDYVISQFSSVKLKKLSVNVIILLRMGTYQIMMLDRVPDSAAVDECVKIAAKTAYRSKAFINAVLRKISAQKDSIKMPKDKKEYLGVVYSYPDSIVEMWQEEFGDEFCEELLRCGNENAKMTVRVNVLKTDSDTLISVLEKKGITASKTDIDSMLVIDGALDVSALEEYKDGLFTPQGIGSYIAGRLLCPAKGDVVIDLCAAPGGKSTHIAEMMRNEGKVFSFDIHEHKIELINAAAKRLGINIINAKAADSSEIKEELIDKADAVLVDAPCSGLGIIRKKPDIKWNFEIDRQTELSDIQYKILSAGAKYVKKGGTLIYSTCTISSAENLDVAEKFLEAHKDFEMCAFDEFLPEKHKKDTTKKGYLQLFPNTDETDGFFVCRMKRKG